MCGKNSFQGDAFPVNICIDVKSFLTFPDIGHKKQNTIFFLVFCKKCSMTGESTKIICIRGKKKIGMSLRTCRIENPP